MTIAGQRLVIMFLQKRIDAVTDELLEVVTSLRFAQSYKNELIRELINSFVREFNYSAFVRELSVPLWSVNQRTTEAEEVSEQSRSRLKGRHS
jgi:hypothetical protein